MNPTVVTIAGTVLLCTVARADDAPDTANSVVVTAMRTPATSFALPMSIERIGRREIQTGQLQINLSETLNSVAGVSAQNRQNYAQDLQVSVRGFGARSSFGVRGVRLFTDGIPATMPDGQGQISHFDLGSAECIEVMRGPFSALYGNSSGGVIAMFTEDAPLAARVDATAQSGSFGMRRYALKGMGQPGRVNLVVAAAHFASEGFRDHSATQRNTFNAKARWQLDEQSRLTLIANAVDSPESLDPLGLTRTQLSADPRQSGTNALAYNTRKSVRQEQGAVRYERSLNAQEDLTAMVYSGHRRATQFQSILQTAELQSAAHPGGVIDLARSYWGMDLHLTDHRTVGGQPLQISGGISFDNLNESRQGFLNFSANQLGIKGTLRRDERNRVYDLGEYLQLQWDPHERWHAHVGARHTIVDERSSDHLLAMPASSSVRYHAFNPVAGLGYLATAALNVYGSYGKGFETPTLNDIAYRSTDGSKPGLNLALRPAHSDNYELGIKAQAVSWRATLAGFYIRTSNELAVDVSSGGRTVFKNIAATRRRGAELELEASLPRGFDGKLAYTHIAAIAPGGYRLPAVPLHALYTSLSWHPHPESIALTVETTVRSKIYVDDLNSDAASGYWLVNLHCELGQRRHAWHFTEMLRIDNLVDRRYVGSVIVNESRSRYFEPEPGRSVYLTLTASRR